MFVYEIPGMIITIQGPTLSIIYPKCLMRTGPLDGLSRSDMAMLAEIEQSSGMVSLTMRGPLHELMHPPIGTKRYLEVYKQHYFGVIPLREAGSRSIPFSELTSTHYHYYTENANPTRSIFQFLEGIARLHEKGNMLHFSLKDFYDLQSKYLAYRQFFTLENLSELVGGCAFEKLLRTRLADLHENPVAQHYLNALVRFRLTIENNIGKKRPDRNAIRSGLEELRSSSGSDASFDGIDRKATNLLAALALGKSGYMDGSMPDAGIARFHLGERSGYRIVNKNIVLTTLVLIYVTGLLINSEKIRGLEFTMLIGYFVFGLFRVSDEEPRFFIPMIKNLIGTLFAGGGDDQAHYSSEEPARAEPRY